MKKPGHELKFISQIKRDGTGVIDLANVDMSFFDNDKFKINSLSVTNKTYIACGFNSFVVQFNKETK